MTRHSLCLLLCVACGGGAEPSSVTMPSAGLPDAAEQLAQRLPPGADGCVVARVGAVATRRRSLVRRVSQAGPIAWAPDAPIAAYAEAFQERDGRRSVRALLHVVDAVAARSWLRDHAPVRVAFDDTTECEDGWGCWRAREVGRIVRLDLGDWDSELPGVERGCATALRDEPDAIEVARVVAARMLVADPFGPSGLPRELVLRPLENGLERRSRVARPRGMSDDELGLMIELLEEDDDEALASAYRHRRALRADGHYVEAAFLWEDLGLARDDEQRMREALAEEARDRLPVPVADVEVSDLRAVRDQVALRRRRMEEARSSERAGHAIELRQLLDRARVSHPDDEALARELVQLLLDVLGDGEAAASAADQMLASGVREPETWRVWRRRALGMVGPEALRNALVRDGVADARSARRAAETLSGFTDDYELAEGMWTAAQQSRSLARRTYPVRDARIPASALVDTLVVLADPDGPSKSIHVVARIDAMLPQSAMGPPEARVLTWPENGATWRVGADRLDSPDHLRGLTRGLLRDLPDEVDVEVLLAAVPYDGRLTEPSGAIRISGRLEGGDLVLRRGSMRLDWPEVARYLASAFEGLENRLFPPPDLAVEAVDAATAERIVERAGEEPVLRCRREGPLVECGASPQLDATRRAWRRVVWPWLGGRAITAP